MAQKGEARVQRATIHDNLLSFKRSEKIDDLMLSDHGFRSDVLVQIDMDGTALNTEFAKRPVYQKTIQMLFGADCTIADFAELLGLSRSETVERLTARFGHLALKPEHASGENPVALGEKILSHRLELERHDPIDVRPGTHKLLDALDRLMVPRAIVTSARESKAKESLTRAHLLPRIHDVVGIGTAGPDGVAAMIEKPNRQLYDVSTARRNAHKALRVGIEDSEPGVAASSASEAYTIYWHDPLVAPLSEKAAATADFTTSSVDDVIRRLTTLLDR